MDGNNKAATESLRKALTINPDNSETLVNLGNVLWFNNEREEARIHLEKALEISDITHAHITLAAVYRELGMDDEAQEHAHYALKNDPPNAAKAVEILRDIYHFQGKKDTALRMSEQLIDGDPMNGSYRMRQAVIKMTYDDPEGWEEYELRYATNEDDLSSLRYHNAGWFAKLFGKKWNGQKTKHLLVHREQGLGDNIQFLRYIPMATERCEKLSLYLPPALQDVAKSSFWHIHNLDICRQMPNVFDSYCLILSLPYLMGMLENTPNEPYIKTNSSHYTNTKLKVGLCWESLSDKKNWNRSITFDLMSELLDIDVHFVSLQYPLKNELESKEWTARFEAFSRSKIENPKLTGDWMKTIHAMNELDLIISVDTSIAHMAAAMGKEVWLLNKYNTDWRWGLQSKTTKWYPSMRIFRQPKMGDWETVINQVKEELKYV